MIPSDTTGVGIPSGTNGFGMKLRDVRRRCWGTHDITNLGIKLQWLVVKGTKVIIVHIGEAGHGAAVFKGDKELVTRGTTKKKKAISRYAAAMVFNEEISTSVKSD